MASGRILAVGRSDEIRSYAGPNTRVVDLEGRLGVPVSSTTTYTSWRAASNYLR